MRARARLTGALTHWRALIALNPNDNQGIRYTLVLLLLDRGLDGDPAASGILIDALRGNRHVPAILSGTSLGEPSPHGYLTMGGADEATWYVEQAGKAWRETPGAGAWLIETAALPDARKRR